MNGDLGKDWYYSFNMYQDFDPGTFKIKSTPYQDPHSDLQGAPHQEVQRQPWRVYSHV